MGMNDVAESHSIYLSWPEPKERVGTYSRMQDAASMVVEQLSAAWKRPVRHNKQIERAALWHALDIIGDCDDLLSSAGHSAYAGPTTGGPTDRYIAEAAIRTLPVGFPLTQRERDILSRNKDLRNNLEFEHGIGDTALGQLALLERWHDWLWTVPIGPSEGKASPNADAELFAVGCANLACSLGNLLWGEQPP